MLVMDVSLREQFCWRLAHRPGQIPALIGPRALPLHPPSRPSKGANSYGFRLHELRVLSSACCAPRILAVSRPGRCQMENGNHPSKRRRLNNGYADSPMSSSSDELAATSDHEMERRRASWSAKKAHTARRRSYRRSHSFSDSGSPDELAVDADTYWGRNTREQSPSRNRSRSRSESRSSRSSSQDESSPEQAKPEESAQGDDDAEEEARPRSEQHDQNDQHEQHSERIPSPPPPPPPPPKPDHLNYKEKFLLKGHLRGVSAVQFSPDGSKIASGGTISCLLSFFFFFIRRASDMPICRGGRGSQGLGYANREAYPYLRGPFGGHFDCGLES